MAGLRESWGEPAQRQIRADARERRLAARWVLPVEGQLIEHGAVLIGPDGRLRAVGPDAAVPHPPHVPTLEFEAAAILPGLINTHTHLELTGFEGQVPDREFSDWITRLRQLKSTRNSADYIEAARRGLADCYASGVTTIADTGDSGAVMRVLSEAEGSGIAYHEVFGPDPLQAQRSLEALQLRIEESSHLLTSRVRIGVSPHAAYSVSGALFRAAAKWARSEGLPLAVHVAESPAEAQFLLAGTGPFAAAWRARGIQPPASGGCTPVAWLGQHDVLAADTLCIHAVQVAPEDIQRLAEADAAVAHCPLSNRAHGHGNAPLQQLLDAGVRVGLGTDSVASVGQLDLLAEARAAGTLAPLDANQLLELCTLSGARAIGLDSEIGSLVVGKWGDCTVIRLPSGSGSVAQRVVASSPADVLLTCLGGREVYRAQ